MRAAGSSETSNNIYLTMITKAEKLINFIITYELYKCLKEKKKLLVLRIIKYV